MFVKIGKPDRKNRAEKIVIDDYDIWNFDHTLALIIVPALKKLKEQKHGAPLVNNEDVPEHLRGRIEELKTNDTSGDTTDKHYFDRWDWVLDQMIWAFQQKLEDWEEQFYSGEIDMDWKKLKDDINKGEDMHEMVYGSNHTFQIDTEGMEKYQKRIDEGIMIFAKYYSALWN